MSSASEEDVLKVGMLAFPNITQLDLTGPYEVFSRVPQAAIDIVWKTRDPVASDKGFIIAPTTDFATAPQFDILVAPGGPGQHDLMDDEETHAFLRRQADGATWLMSVCTGSLVYAAAGLITGYRSTTHWLSLPLLEVLGVTPVSERVVVDRNHIATAGVSAGIDGALSLVAELYDDDLARTIQLLIEYDPQPPFDAGSPATAPADLTDRIRSLTEGFRSQRLDAARAAARRLGLE